MGRFILTLPLVNGIIVSKRQLKRSLPTRLKAKQETSSMSITQSCSHDGCSQIRANKYRTSYCSPHYWRSVEGRDMDAPIQRHAVGLTPYERVISNTKQVGECVVFTGLKTAAGYGRVSDSSKKNGKSLAHRVVAEHHLGKSELNVLHSCDNPSCVNIEHLRYGDQKENMRDAVKRHRTTRGYRNSQTKLSEDVVLSIFKSSGKHADIAKKFNVPSSTVGNIKCGYSWGWLTGTRQGEKT